MYLNMKIKRIFCILSFALLTFALSACAGSDSTAIDLDEDFLHFDSETDAIIHQRQLHINSQILTIRSIEESTVTLTMDEIPASDDTLNVRSVDIVVTTVNNELLSSEYMRAISEIIRISLPNMEGKSIHITDGNAREYQIEIE